MTKQTVLIVGPWAGTGGITVHSMRNLCIHSVSRFTEHAICAFDLSATKNNGQQRIQIFSPVTQNVCSKVSWSLANIPKQTSQSSCVMRMWFRSKPLITMLFGNRCVCSSRQSNGGKPAVVRFGGSFDKFYESSTPQQQQMIEHALQIGCIGCPIRMVEDHFSQSMLIVQKYT